MGQSPRPPITGRMPAPLGPTSPRFGAPATPLGGRPLGVRSAGPAGPDQGMGWGRMAAILAALGIGGYGIAGGISLPDEHPTAGLLGFQGDGSVIGGVPAALPGAAQNPDDVMAQRNRNALLGGMKG